MKRDEADNLFESGDPLKNDNFDQWWLGFFLVALVLLTAIAVPFLIWLNHHATHWRPS